MRSKAPLALMEQLIMVLVFALAAALCLRGFSVSDKMSRENELRDNAALLAQNAAEVCKHFRGDFVLATEKFGGEQEDGVWRSYYDEKLSEDSAASAYYTVVAAVEETDVEGLGRAKISVFSEEDSDALFELYAAWQEVTRR